MNKTEAADYLGISRNTLDKLIETKGLPVKKIDGRYIFQRRALDDWLKNDEQT
ncbi:helix-turn-helix domain-containing protein [Limosilactobacillus fermentum]